MLALFSTLVSGAVFFGCLGAFNFKSEDPRAPVLRFRRRWDAAQSWKPARRARVR